MNPERILVINDSQAILEMFSEILTEEGYEVLIHTFTGQSQPKSSSSNQT